ncbi:MAG: hypothetical protein H6508_06825 [Calditrichaeota bacterium]|nr:hypothetical protein [Calditrichota bacterium]
MSALDLVHRLIAPEWLDAGHIVLFEDAATSPRLFPLNVLRPSWECLSGLGSLRSWLEEVRMTGTGVSLRLRMELVEAARESAGFDDDWPESVQSVVFLNGRVLRMPVCKTSLPEAVADADGNLLWAKVSGKKISETRSLPGTALAETLVKTVGGTVPAAELGVVSAGYVWDYMLNNEHLLHAALDGARGELRGSEEMTSTPQGVHRIGEQPVFVGAGCTFLPGVVLDTSGGSIWMGEGVSIEPHCYLKGPLSIGSHCKVKAGTVLYSGSSFGPHCRVSGEISGSILQGYVNKQHAGFLGNSHLGEWVNLGADTTVSNLRNDYGNVALKVGQSLVDSGSMFVGLMCGDHTKTGINTMFNTGTIVGVGANVFGEGYPPRSIRSFAWGGKRGVKFEPVDRLLETARTAMSRRGRELTKAQEALLRQHFGNVVNQENEN